MAQLKPFSSYVLAASGKEVTITLTINAKITLCSCDIRAERELRLAIIFFFLPTPKQKKQRENYTSALMGNDTEENKGRTFPLDQFIEVQILTVLQKETALSTSFSQ